MPEMTIPKDASTTNTLTVDSIKPKLALTPKVDPCVARFLANQSKVNELVHALGSPLNILFPELIRQNVKGFQNVFAKHGIIGKVFFAHKSNRSDCLVRELALTTANLDVSSVHELRHALGSGFVGSRLEATGPKNSEFLSLALMHGVTLSIDSIAELELVVALRKELNLKAPTKVLIRLSGFSADHSKFLNKGSRFGIPVSEIKTVFAILDEQRKDINFAGFSFHLDTVSPLERAVAIENCLFLFEDALQMGFEPHILNIGGGYKVNYLQEESEWNEYTSALRQSVLGTGESLTWQGNAFGLIPEKGKLRGNFNSYNYYDEVTGPRYLDELLSQQLPNIDSSSAAQLLADNMIELWIEPGRALIDQCGITLASVNSLRPSTKGDNIVCLGMKRQDVTFLDQEIFVDPVILYMQPESAYESETENQPVYFAGNLCLESDLIYRHKTFLPKLPKPGDIVAFINTAGYFMDFSASQSIMQPIARKVAVVERNNNFTWTLDEQYSPVSHIK